MKTKKGLLCLFLALITVLSLFSCGEDSPVFCKEEYSTSAGTLTLWAAYSHGDGEKAEAFTDEELSEILKKTADRFETVYTMLTKGQALAEVNGETDVILDADEVFLSVLNQAFKLSADTNGAFTPAHGAYTELKKSGNITEEAVAEALSHCGTDKFIIDKTTVRKSDRKAKIDLCSFAAGYALDEALKVLTESGVEHGRLSLGNLEEVFGSKPDGNAYTIGIENDGVTHGYFRITDGCVSSADTDTENLNYAEKDGDFTKVTVFASQASTAEALSRVLLNMSEEEAKALYESHALSFEAVMITKDGKTVMTDRAETGLYIEETSETEKDG